MPANEISHVIIGGMHHDVFGGADLHQLAITP